MLQWRLKILSAITKTKDSKKKKNTSFPDGSDSKESLFNMRDPVSIAGKGRFPGEGNGLENSMDRGAWWATVHVVAKSQTELSKKKKRTYIPLRIPINEMWSPVTWMRSPSPQHSIVNISVDSYLPLPGVYFFTFSMMKHEDVEEVYVYLMHNGNTVFSMYR